MTSMVYGRLIRKALKDKSRYYNNRYSAPFCVRYVIDTFNQAEIRLFLEVNSEFYIWKEEKMYPGITFKIRNKC